MPEVGFVLLTHTHPSQIARLIARLNALYDYPPIVCHHDFSKCSLEQAQLSPNVTLVYPHFLTSWADFSVVEAAIRGIQLLFSQTDTPKWGAVLSGADYPIKGAEKVVFDLNEGTFDAHMLNRAIDRTTRKRHPWIKQCFRRYCSTRFLYPSLDRKLRPRHRTLRVRIPFYTEHTLPFSSSFGCYAGRQWFTLNRRSAEAIVRSYHERPDLVAHFRAVPFPEEAYFQTILANEPGLCLNQQDWRYIDFPPGAVHPKTLTMADLPLLLSSSAHFARKFDPATDSQVLDELDRHLTDRYGRASHHFSPKNL